MVTAKVTTTVQTTTTQQVAVSNVNAVSTAANSAAQTTTAASSSTAQAGKHEVSVTAVAGKMDSRVISAFQRLGFKVYVDPSVNYSGYFDARSRSITMKETSDATYHELGHFLAFIAGNVDKSSSFQAVYNAEKANVTSFNKAYVTQNASEYFAESVRDYILNNASLKSSRPQTYAAVQTALNQITDAQITKIEKIYGPFMEIRYRKNAPGNYPGRFFFYKGFPRSKISELCREVIHCNKKPCMCIIRMGKKF